MQTDKILYLVVLKDSMGYAKRDKWIVCKVYETREQATNYIQERGAKACTVVAELVENMEQKKASALSKLSAVEKFLLGIGE